MLDGTNFECGLTGKRWEIEDDMKQFADLDMTATIIHSKFMVVLLSQVSFAMLSDSRASTQPLQLLTSSSRYWYEVHPSVMSIGVLAMPFVSGEMRQQRKTDAYYDHRAANRAQEIDA